MFNKLDLDVLIAGRTAPSNSWANPVERIMSISNIGKDISIETVSPEVYPVCSDCSSIGKVNVTRPGKRRGRSHQETNQPTTSQ